MTQNEASKALPPSRSTFRLDSGWPDQPPVFAPLTATDELRVPLASHLLTEPLDPIHGSVRQGERLVDHAAQSSHLAIVPADAVAEAEVRVPLLDGREVPATRLRLTHADLPESPRPDSPRPDSPRPESSSPEFSRPEFSRPEPPGPESPSPASGKESGTGGIAPANGSQAIRRADDFAEIQPADLGAWIDRLRDGGIWVDRWASPDLLGQLNSCLRRPVDTLICNVLDVDPAVPLNAALAANHPIELLAGLTLLSRITSATRALIVTDANTPLEWSSQLRNLTAETVRPAGLRVIPMINDYPQADPSLLLYALLNRRLRPGRLPAELGALVLDSAAAIAVGRLALTGQPMLTVPLAIRDHARRESHFCTVAIGTLLTHILRRLGLPPAQQLVLRGGDVLRDIQLTEDAVVGGTELLVHASPLEPPINPDPCVRCGWCFEACPTYVQPANCLEAAQRDDADLAIRFGIEACIDCGICSYVCPSHLPILSGIRWMRGRLKE